MELTVREIADVIGGRITGDERVALKGVSVFEAATTADLTFIDNAGLLKRIHETRAGAVIVPEDFSGPASCPLVRVPNPRLGFAKLIAIFYPDKPAAPGISNRAACSDDMVTGRGVSIGDCVSVGKRVRLGDRVCLHPGAVIGDGVVIGDDTVIGPNVTVMDRCRIGSRVKLNAGTVVGSDGFGFEPDGNTYFKIRHIGIVQIDDDVEIGANNTIDRGKFGKTHICRGVKTDNLVHIGHNVTVGEDTLLVAQVGIAGSVTIGKHAILAGQAGIAQHLTIGDHAVVGPQAGLVKSLGPGEVVSGTYAMPHRIWLRLQRILPGLPAFIRKVEQLEKRLHQLESKKKK